MNFKNNLKILTVNLSLMSALALFQRYRWFFKFKFLKGKRLELSFILKTFKAY